MTVLKEEADESPNLVTVLNVQDKGAVEGTVLELMVRFCWKIIQVGAKYQYYTDAWSTSYDYEAESLQELKARVADTYKVVLDQDTTKADIVFTLSRAVF